MFCVVINVPQHLQHSTGAQQSYWMKDKWDVWPFPYCDMDRAIEDARKFMKYLTGAFQIRIIHDLDGAIVWTAAQT